MLGLQGKYLGDAGNTCWQKGTGPKRTSVTLTVRSDLEDVKEAN